MATLQRRSEAEIAEIRAARAAKKAAAADEDGDAARRELHVAEKVQAVAHGPEQHVHVLLGAGLTYPITMCHVDNPFLSERF